jgi:mannose-6-phosphate isomerase-like protein (cupin superfamily)
MSTKPTAAKTWIATWACWAGLLAMVLGTACRGGAAEPAKPAKPPQPLRSQIVPFDAARATQADWGEMRRYFTGETAGTKNVLTAVAIVKPGKSVHRAHRHAEEEYLMLVEGSGTWSLDGKTSPANRGDILYAAPWVYHGLSNTGSDPLIFIVVRYTPKGQPVPPRPDNRPDEQ